MSTVTHTPIISTYRAAAIQYEPTRGEKEKNTTDLLRLVTEAAEHGARLIVLPEMATTGNCWESRSEIAPYVEPISGPTTDRFEQLATKYNCFIAIGLAEVDPVTNIYYNSLALLGPEGIVGTYRKVHSSISEPRWARDGDLGFPVWETPLGRLAAIISIDSMYFEAARIPALHGADVLLFPTNWPDDLCSRGPGAGIPIHGVGAKKPGELLPLAGKEAWEASTLPSSGLFIPPIETPSSIPSSSQVWPWWIARAFENGVYFIAANRYGVERGVQFSGGSCILNPDGSIQQHLKYGEGIVYGDIDLSRSRNKSWGPTGEEPTGDRLADRQPAEYTTLVNNTYLWEPLRYHSLYAQGALPPGQLSCVAVIQTDLHTFQTLSPAAPSPQETLQLLHGMVKTLINDHDPARPDILVLPELMLPGPTPHGAGNIASNRIRAKKPAHLSRREEEAAIAHFQAGAIRIPGPETAALVELANEFQVSLVLGVAERVDATYYNTVLLIDPEGIYGIYRKLHLTRRDRHWATPGDLGLPTFDTPVGRIGLATGYDVLFPETSRILASKGTDLVCAPTLLNFPQPIDLASIAAPQGSQFIPQAYDPLHYLLWRVRAAEHNVYLALANWSGQRGELRANGNSGIFSPTCSTHPWSDVIADEGEPSLTMMTIDTREQRTGRRSTTLSPNYTPGDVIGSLTGELAYNILDTIPGNVARSKPILRKRIPVWYLDLLKIKK